MFKGLLKSRVLWYLGRYRYFRGDIHGARECFERMITIRPSALGGYVLLASCNIELQRYNEAVPPLQEALQAEPDLAVAHGYLGIAF